MVSAAQTRATNAGSGMDLSQLKSEQLEAYLSALTPKAAEFLVREVERDRLNGGTSYPHDLVLEKAREILKQANRQCSRLASPQRVFCQPFEAMLVNRRSAAKQKGRIARNSADVIWKWLLTDIASDTLPQLSTRITQAALSEADEQLAELTNRLYKLCHERLGAALDTVEPDSKAFVRIAAQLGGEHIVQDAYEIRDCMKCAPALLSHIARTPSTVEDLQDEDAKLYARWYLEFESVHPDQAYILLIALMSRCTRAADMLSIVIDIVGSNDAHAAARHSAGAVVEVMLHDMEIAAEWAREDLLSGADIAVVKMRLAEFHGGASALCDAMELDLRGAWGNRLVTMRSELSAAIRERIGAAPRLIKSALFQRPGRRDPQRAMQSPDPQSVKDAEFAVNLLLELRPFLSQLTLNADYSRIKSEVEQFLEVIADRLLRDLQNGAEDARAFAEEGYPAAGRLMRTVFGIEASELYLRRARAALQSTDKTESA